MGSDVEERMDEFLKMWNTFDVEGLLGLYEETCVYEDVTLGHAYEGHDQLRVYAQWINDRLDELDMRATRKVVAEERAVLEWTSDANGGEANGGTTIRGVTLFEFGEGERFRGSSDYWNAAAMVRVAGPSAIEAMDAEISDGLRRLERGLAPASATPLAQAAALGRGKDA